MPGAGSGTRLGASLPKALLDVDGSPLFVRAAEPFVRHADCVEIIIAAPAGYAELFERAAAGLAFPGLLRVIPGGATRQESVARALNALTSPAEAVLIHDAARPFLSLDLILRVLDALGGPYVAALPGLPVTDTVKRIAGDPPTVLDTVDRSALVTVQTPQAILTSVARQAQSLAAQSGYTGTDDVSLVEHFQLGRIRLVEGDPRNFKITTPDDLSRARQVIREQMKARETAR